MDKNLKGVLLVRLCGRMSIVLIWIKYVVNLSATIKLLLQAYDPIRCTFAQFGILLSNIVIKESPELQTQESSVLLFKKPTDSFGQQLFIV